jgi:hypothetical protein
MDNEFYSNPNFYLLKGIACKVVQKKYSYTMRDEFDNNILKIMENASKKVAPRPSHIDPQLYTKSLNKKVLDIIVANIHMEINNRVNNKPVQSVHPSITKSDQNLTNGHNREMGQQTPQAVDYNASLGNYKRGINLEYAAAADSQAVSSNDLDQINQLANNQIHDLHGGTSIDELHSQTRNHMFQANNVLENNETNDINTNMNNFPTTNTNKNLYTNMNTDLETNTNNFNVSTTPQYVNNQPVPGKSGNIQSGNIQPVNSQTYAQQSIDLQRDTNYTLERNNNIMVESSDAPHKLFHDVNAKRELDRINQQPHNMTGSYPIITPTQTKHIERFEYITIDSRDRDLSRFPNTNNFEIKFSPASDSFDVPTYLDTNNLVRWGTAVKYHGDDKGASIGVSYDNVLSVECVQALFPGESHAAWGRFPHSYNTQAHTTDPFAIDYSTGTDGVGVLTSVMDESYLFLHVEELDGPYRGTSIAGENAFTKLVHDGFFGTTSVHIQMKPVDGEYKLYTPTTLGKLNKMTVNVKKHNNVSFNFGNDKTYISATALDASPSNINYCPTVAPFNNFTKITINTNHTDYPNGCISGHGLKPGDLIYIYSTIPSEHDFTLTHNSLVFERNGSNQIKRAVIYNRSATQIDNTEFDFNTLLSVGDFIKYGSVITRIADLDSTNDYITITGDISGESATTSNFGFHKVNRRGKLSDNPHALNYIDGIRVISVIDESNFIINFSFDTLNTILQTADAIDPLLIDELFFIKKKLQVSYTFKVITLEKDYEQIKSNLNQ